MAVKPLWISPPQFVDANGDPYSGALLFFYAAGSSTKQNVYTDSTGNTACSNPITLNSSGYPEVSGTITAPWGTVGQTYKVGLAATGESDPPASFIWTTDNLSPINDTSVTIDQWVASGLTPTYVSGTQFTLAGDQTSAFTVGRRLKTTNTGGTIYSTVTVSAYGALTTVTVVNDSGVLDSGLSAVSYGLLTPNNPSFPVLKDSDFRISGSADQTKKVAFEVDGLTTATTRTLTVQDSSDTLVGRATTDTLTNKTLTSPVINTGVSGTAIADASAMAAMTSSTLIVTPAANKIILGTEQASTSGTSIDFTSIPAGVRRVTIMFSGVSTNGTSPVIIQIGDSGGVEASGYLGSAGKVSTPAAANYTAGFGVSDAATAADVLHGTYVLNLEDATGFTWVGVGIMSRSDTGQVYLGSGSKSLSAELDRVRITTAGGTDTFDAGAINISYDR